MEVENKFFDLFSSFILDIAKTYPETKQCLYRNYGDYLDDEKEKSINDEKIQKFINIIHEHHTLITNKDESLFKLDIEYLHEISFKNLWVKNISDKTKKIFWKYLQSFALISISLKSNDALNIALEKINEDEFSKDIVKDKDVAKNLSEMKKLADGLKEEIKEGDESGFEDMIGDLMETGIGSIAKEVAESVDMEKMFGSLDDNANPMDIISNMMNPEKMNEIFSNIGEVVEKKKKSGEFSEDSLKSEAEGLYGQMGSNPLFSNLMKQMGVPGGMATPSTSEVSEEDNREKLKQKIREKQRERTRG
jgi:hypothetical protein